MEQCLSLWNIRHSLHLAIIPIWNVRLTFGKRANVSREVGLHTSRSRDNIAGTIHPFKSRGLQRLRLRQSTRESTRVTESSHDMSPGPDYEWYIVQHPTSTSPETVCNLDFHLRPHFLQARVSCNCKKACDMRRCRCFKNDSKCSVYCHKSVEHNFGNLKLLSERTETSLLPRESLQDADSDSSDGNIGNENPSTAESPRLASTASAISSLRSSTFRLTRSSTRLYTSAE